MIGCYGESAEDRWKQERDEHEEPECPLKDKCTQERCTDCYDMDMYEEQE